MNLNISGIGLTFILVLGVILLTDALTRYGLPHTPTASKSILADTDSETDAEDGSESEEKKGEKEIEEREYEALLCHTEALFSVNMLSTSETRYKHSYFESFSRRKLTPPPEV